MSGRERTGRQRFPAALPDLIDTPDGPMTRKQISARYGIPYGTVCRNVWRGTPINFIDYKTQAQRRTERDPEPAPPVYRGRFYTPWGLLSLGQVAHQIGMRRQGLASRLYQGQWPHDVAFNTPLFGKPGVHFVLPPDEYRRRTMEIMQADRDASNKRKGRWR